MKASSTIRSGIVSGKVMTADLLWRDKAFPESFGTVATSRPAIWTMTRDSGRAKLHWETCSFDRTATVPNDRSTIRFHSDRFSLKFTSWQIPISQRLFRLFIHFRNSCYIDSDLIAILHVSQYFSVDTRFQSWKSCLRFVLRIRSTFHWALFSAFYHEFQKIYVKRCSWVIFSNSFGTRVRADTAALSHSQSDNSFLAATVKHSHFFFFWRGTKKIGKWRSTFPCKKHADFPAAE